MRDPTQSEPNPIRRITERPPRSGQVFSEVFRIETVCLNRAHWICQCFGLPPTRFGPPRVSLEHCPICRFRTRSNP
jgi:hypothetical protein